MRLGNGSHLEDADMSDGESESEDDAASQEQLHMLVQSKIHLSLAYDGNCF